ncbi:hypothetical protein JTB14_022347 [Gonioctena quinquepunctata]|nr:hypothetical protein JTB14_022347 [Gonioctena quinquepunctata]
MILSALLFIFGVSVAKCANILAIVPAPFYSHQIAFQEIWKELSRRGHQVTLITTVPIDEPDLVNLTVIDMSRSYKLLTEKYTISKTAENILNMWNWYDIFAKINRDAAEEQLSSVELQDLIHRHHNYHFDLVLVESYFPEFLTFAKIYDCPSVLLTSVDGHTEFHRAMGNPVHPVLNADYATAFHVELGFFERVTSTVYSLYVSSFETFYVNPAKQKIIDKYFTNSSVTLSQLIKNVDLLFLDCHPVIQGPRAIGPTTINIGMERRLIAKHPLTKELKYFMDNASEGFIYMSLGSNVRSKDLNKDTLESIVEVFRKLPFRVVWKFEDDRKDRLEGIPDNIMVVKWAPQQLVLKHPNIKLFITQGGLQSLEEAVYSNVPLVVIPYFADQFKNARLMEYKGIGKKVGRKPFVKGKELEDAILEVITDQRYKENISKMGKWAKDVPMTGLEKAVWWTEYVIRHKGSKHLRNPAADIPLYQYFLLDVIGFLLIALMILIALFFISISRIMKYILSMLTLEKKSKLS